MAYRSMFGANFGSAALNAAYDMMVLEEIEKEDKELALRNTYPIDFDDEEADFLDDEL